MHKTNRMESIEQVLMWGMYSSITQQAKNRRWKIKTLRESVVLSHAEWEKDEIH